MSEATPADEDEVSAGFGTLFSAAAGPRRVEDRGPEAAPAPQEPQPPTPVQGAPIQGDAVTQLLASIELLHVRLHQVEQQVASAAQQSYHLHRRLEDLGQALFDWFEEFSDWQRRRFDQLDRAVDGGRDAPPG